MPQQGPTADLESEQRAHRKHAGECHPQQEIAISVLHLIAVTALYQAQHLNGNVSQLLLKWFQGVCCSITGSASSSLFMFTAI
jgi:hypothetical protein